MNILAVHKIPKLQQMTEEDPERLDSLRRATPELHTNLVEASVKQVQSIEEVADALNRYAGRVEMVSQREFSGVPDDVDLVVVIGGDGTVLDVSHRVKDHPVVAVNSDPDRSVGYFAASDAEGVGETVQRFAAGHSNVTKLHRIQVVINGEPYPFPCMNDLLVANQHPAMMSRYIIRAGRLEETHNSSGIWISTPAGSTGGIRSAGGTVLPLRGAMIQYLVREPYHPRGESPRLSRGIRHVDEGLELRSLMGNGRIYVDGPYLEIPFEYGDVLEVSPGPPLSVLDVHPELRGR